MKIEKKKMRLCVLSILLNGCSSFNVGDIAEVKLKETNFESTLRSPANEGPTCREILQTFYLKQDEERIVARIKATRDDSHKFFRSFPPLFYKILADLDIDSSLGEIIKFKGVIGGDVHIENFEVRTFKGKLKLLINDFDDLSEGPIFYDVVRLLTSIKLSGVDVDDDFVKEFLVRYKDGLKAKKENFSEVTKKFFKDSKKADRLSSNKVNFKKKKFIRSKKREPSFEMTKDEVESWTKLIKDKGELHDQYKYVKDSGGSGGLDRYELLIEHEGELIWVEAKDWEIPGINAGLGTKAPSYEKRLEYVRQYDQPDFVSYTIKYDGKTFFLREVSEAHIGLAIDGLSKKERKLMFLDEAYALGSFHRAFGASDDYVEELKKVSAGHVNDQITRTHEQVVDYNKKKLKE